MWIYSQSLGLLSNEELKLSETGYAGFGEGKNNPAMQDKRNVGPPPRGTYRIGAPENGTHMGPYAMSLSPAFENKMYGRSGFYMHSDSLAHPGTASQGCIICTLTMREKIWCSGDHILQVVV